MKKMFRNFAALAIGAVCIVSSAVYPCSVSAASSSENVSANIVSLLGNEDYRKLAKAGIISDSPENVSPKEATGANVGIESVSTYKDSFVVVTFDSGFKTSSVSDIKLKKYSDNWFALKPNASSMNITDKAYTLNEEGKSVFIFRVSDEIDGTRIKHSTENAVNADLVAKVKKDEGNLVTIADNFVSWQLENGGWYKSVDVQKSNAYDLSNSKVAAVISDAWKDSKGKVCGTIDNDATYTQMYYIAAAYQKTKNTKYKKSIEKGLEFIDLLQYPSGGLAQVYPARGGVAYSSYVTFNDNAMINALLMLEDIEEGNYPFNSDLVSDEYRAKTTKMLDDATDYILKSQIESQGRLTGWCAQHDPKTYEPKGGRAFELISISGCESIPVIKFLMNRDDQTPEVINAWKSAIEYFKDSEVKGKKYETAPALDENGNQIYSDDGKKALQKAFFTDDPNSSIWYRFYEIGTNRAIFGDRVAPYLFYDISEISYERQGGYSWAGKWPKSLIDVYDSVGYYPNKITAEVSGTSSKTPGGISLKSKDSSDVSFEIDTSGISMSDSMLTLTKSDGSTFDVSTDLLSKAGYEIGDNAFSAYEDVRELYIPKEVTTIAENAFSGLENAVIFCEEGSPAAAYLSGKDYEYAYVGDADGNKKVTATDGALLFKYSQGKDDGIFGKNGKRAVEYLDPGLSDDAYDKILEEVRKVK